MVAAEGINYAQRAARALDALIPPRDRDKAVARLFNCSVRTAKYLRVGKAWTLGRLNQASTSFGGAFDRLLFGGPLDDERMRQEIVGLLKKVEEQDARIRQLEEDLSYSREMIRLAAAMLKRAEREWTEEEPTT